ncbi:helix-turn-helix domain-containing protein [Oenococcus alcoholitolerans]|uniref:helix-turn-helix domain-containing protein n=1 Tax=Oenococcus alcoholitolerans TaxID=931074 RepID=UPI003F72AA62
MKGGKNINYENLLKRMHKFGINQAQLARKMNISPSSITLKLLNKRGFSQNDVIKIANILEIPPKDFGKYFFNQTINNT